MTTVLPNYRYMDYHLSLCQMISIVVNGHLSFETLMICFLQLPIQSTATQVTVSIAQCPTKDLRMSRKYRVLQCCRNLRTASAVLISLRARKYVSPANLYTLQLFSQLFSTSWMMICRKDKIYQAPIFLIKISSPCSLSSNWRSVTVLSSICSF